MILNYLARLCSVAPWVDELAQLLLWYPLQVRAFSLTAKKVHCGELRFKEPFYLAVRGVDTVNKVPLRVSRNHRKFIWQPGSVVITSYYVPEGYRLNLAERILIDHAMRQWVERFNFDPRIAERAWQP